MGSVSQALCQRCTSGQLDARLFCFSSSSSSCVVGVRGRRLNSHKTLPSKECPRTEMLSAATSANLDARLLSLLEWGASPEVFYTLHIQGMAGILFLFSFSFVWFSFVFFFSFLNIVGYTICAKPPGIRLHASAAMRNL